MPDNAFNYKTKIWTEEAEAEDPFVTKTALCSGYDVYGDLLGKINWSEYLFLLFQLEKPTQQQARLLEELAIILAHPGMRDHSVLAAMNAGVGGSTAAACLIAALGVGAGQLNGAREVFLSMQMWEECGREIHNWRHVIENPTQAEVIDIWDPIEHVPGFNPNANICASTIIDSLEHLSHFSTEDKPIGWLKQNRQKLELLTQQPLNFSGIAAACFHELALTDKQGEMLYLLLRLPGAAVHALEQSDYGWRKFPFYEGCLTLTSTDTTHKLANDNIHAEDPIFE